MLIETIFASHTEAWLASDGQIQNRIRPELDPRGNAHEMLILADDLTW